LLLPQWALIAILPILLQRKLNRTGTSTSKKMRMSLESSVPQVILIRERQLAFWGGFKKLLAKSK